jgi:type IV pilus assembly protein PilF
MNKYLFNKRVIFTALSLLPILLSGCVTQNYENDDTPVVQNQSNRDDMAATRVSLGLGYLKMGNMPQAKQNLEKAKKFAPDMVQVYTAFAHYYETVGEHEQTIESYEEALSIKSDDADTLNNYGVYLCRQDQTDKAEEQLLKAISVPSYILVAKSYENLSSCFLKKDNFDKAEMYLNKAILHSPSSSSTLLQMVRLQYAMGDYEQAKLVKQRFEKVTRRFSSQSLALAYKVHFKLGQRKTAQNYGAMLVKMYPQSWESQQYILNKLEVIQADNLAKRYQASQITEIDSQPKKRTVKLSPKKSIAVSDDLILTTNQQTLATNEDDKADLLNAKESTVKLNSTVSDKKTIIKTSTETDKKNKPVKVLIPNMAEQDKIANETIATVSEKNQEIDKLKEEVKPVETEAKQRFPDFHVVKKGDTLYNISVKYNIKIKALRKWNKISKNKKLHIKDIIFLENPKSLNQ